MRFLHTTDSITTLPHQLLLFHPKIYLCVVSLSLPQMASLQSLTWASPTSHGSKKPSFPPGIFPRAALQCLPSSIKGQQLPFPCSRRSSCMPCSSKRSTTIMMVKPSIQFIQGTDERTIPDVRLTKSRDGTNGMAIFRFDEPSVFDSSGELGDITGLYMIDEEGVIQSVDVNAKFVNGKPAVIEAKYVMRTPREWDRFMRFMERYSDANGLQFVKK